MEKNVFDVVIIGGGPGGYVAAIRAAQLGLKVACVEKRGALGGTCLNVGCIPSKALLESSAKYHELKTEYQNHGIECSSVKLNLDQMMKRKNQITADLNKGIEFLFNKNKITYFKGAGKILSSNQVQVKTEKSEEVIDCKNIVIATGSEVSSLPGVEIDEIDIISSTGALSLNEVPKKMVVIGAGVIGLEMSSVWQRLGTEVTVVEYMDRITPGMDAEVSKQLQKILENQKIKFLLSTKLLAIKKQKNGIEVEIQAINSNKLEKIIADKVLVAVGRKPNTALLGLEELNIKKDDRGRVVVDDHYRSSISNIYAIGDVIAGPMLAHKAEEEGIAVAEIIAGQAGHVNYNLIPGVIYTSPEVAAVGKTEEQLKDENIDYRIGKFPFAANSRAKAIGHTDGFVKILARADNDEVLGVHIIGPHAGSLIAEAVLAMEYKASSEDIARTCHSHPDLNEAVKEAAMDVLKMAIHK